MTSPPKAPNEGRIARLREVLGRKAIRQRVLSPVAFDAAFLGTTLITGVAVARSLGPEGRGQVVAIMLIAQTAGWLFAIGATEAISYRLAKEPKTGARLIGSWLSATLPLTVLAIIAAQVMLPVLFNAQTEYAIELARIYIFYVGLIIAQGIFTGILLGDEDFFYFNVARLVAPVATAIGYIGVIIAGVFTVEAALIINAAAGALSFAVAAVRSLQRHHIGKPDLKLLRETAWYGFRAHAGSVANIVNGRLDLLIIPAFLSAASVGLYSVATNSTSIISTLTGSVAIFVLPVAVRRGTHSARTVIHTFHAVLGIGVLLAIPLAIFTGPILHLIYGSEFTPAAMSLRILLPGAILDSAAVVLYAGLLAANRPFLSSVATLPAATITVGGLVIFLQSGGIEAAAIVTSSAYVVSFFVVVGLYRHVAKLRWRDFIRAPEGPTTVASGPEPGA